MIGTKMGQAGVVQYELEIKIQAPAERVWRAIIEETNFWWLPDFHMVDAGSTVTFDPCPGGAGIVESSDDGGSLLWYSVQYYLPAQFTIYLVGNIAPDWGGPSTSHLKLSLAANETGCALKVTDAQHGNVSESSARSLAEGWTQLFTEGLKAFVENGTRRDP